MVGLPPGQPASLKGDPVNHIERTEALEDFGVQIGCAGTAEGDMRGSGDLQQHAPLGPEDQRGSHHQSLTSPPTIGGHSPVKLDVQLDAATPRIVPHPFDLNAREAVTRCHKRSDRLVGRQVEYELLNLGVTAFLHDLDQVDVSTDRTQRGRHSTQASRPVRQKQPQKQHSSRSTTTRPGLSCRLAAHP